MDFVDVVFFEALVLTLCESEAAADFVTDSCSLTGTLQRVNDMCGARHRPMNVCVSKGFRHVCQQRSVSFGWLAM